RSRTGRAETRCRSTRRSGRRSRGASPAPPPAPPRARAGRRRRTPAPLATGSSPGPARRWPPPLAALPPSPHPQARSSVQPQAVEPAVELGTGFALRDQVGVTPRVHVRLPDLLAGRRVGLRLGGGLVGGEVERLPEP